MTEDNKENKLFNYLHDIGLIAIDTEMHEILLIVLESEAFELKHLELLQQYNLEHGFNDEKINERILVLKGLKKETI